MTQARTHCYMRRAGNSSYSRLISRSRVVYWSPLAFMTWMATYLAHLLGDCLASRHPTQYIIMMNVSGASVGITFFRLS
jgi:hypothetical protein